MKWFLNPKLFGFFVFLTAILFFSNSGFANGETYGMKGNTYEIDSDSLNFAGATSSSGTYSMLDTAGEIATGTSTSETYAMSAGFLNAATSNISINVSSALVTMDKSLGGLTDGISQGETTVTVTTDNSAGYDLWVKADASPALHSSDDNFADYLPGADPDHIPDFTFAVTGGKAVFGFSPEGPDIVSRFKNDGVGTCNLGTKTSDACWDGFSISQKKISEGLSGNVPNGTPTKIKFKAGVGLSNMKKPGTYQANITVTAVSL